MLRGSLVITLWLNVTLREMRIHNLTMPTQGQGRAVVHTGKPGDGSLKYLSELFAYFEVSSQLTSCCF